MNSSASLGCTQRELHINQEEKFCHRKGSLSPTAPLISAFQADKPDRKVCAILNFMVAVEVIKVMIDMKIIIITKKAL